MRSSASRLAYAALLSLASLSAAACGSGETTQRYTGCVDHDGFPVSCDTPGAMPAQKVGAPHLSFPLSANGAVAFDANDELVAFFAASPHAAEVRGAPVGELVLELDGRLLWRGMPAGWVVYAESSEGGRVAVLVDDAGRLLDLEVTPGGTRLRPTDVPAHLAAPGVVPSRPEVRALTPLPVAFPDSLLGG